MQRFLILFLLTTACLGAQGQQLDPNDYIYPLRELKQRLYSANFGEIRPGHFHAGVDIKTDAEEGKPVVAAADGYVSRVVLQAGGYGRAVYLTLRNGTTVVYGHLRRFRDDIERHVRRERYERRSNGVNLWFGPGTWPVKQGDVVAYSGDSGSSGGPHLHYEIRDTETQRLYNPVREGIIRPRDEYPPRIVRLHYVEVDSLGDVPVHSRPRTFDVVRRSEGDYALRQTQPVAVGRRGYFIVECSDRKDEVYNTFGIYRLTEEVDGEVRYEYRMDGFLFGDTRYCNAVSYYPMQLSSRNEVIRLTQPAGCPDRFFTTMKNRALLTTPAGRRQEVRITAEDDCGNRSVLAFTVEGKADERSFHAPACDSLPVVRHDRDFHREGDGVRIEIPAGTLYESCFYTQRPHDEPQPKDSTLLFLSRGVEILDVRLPMHRYATLWIDATQVPPELRRYAVLASLSPKGKLRYEGGKWSDGRIRLRTRSLGTFFVVADTVRPTIRPRFTAHDLSGQRSVTFSVSDNFSGVGSVSCLVDGRMAILEENRVKGTYTHYFDDELFGRNREHTLRLTATDGAGNTRVWEGTYYR